MGLQEYIDENNCLHIQVVPNAKQTEFVGIFTENIIKIRVQGVPEKGKVNKNLLHFIAKELGVSKNKVSLVAGSKNRRKTVCIDFG